jgi:hypothetical protein
MNEDRGATGWRGFRAPEIRVKNYDALAEHSR